MKLLTLFLALIFLHGGFLDTSVARSAGRTVGLSIATTFHPADALFGGLRQELFAAVRARDYGKTRLRRSRSTALVPPARIVSEFGRGGVDGVLLDPIRLRYRPAIAQVFGGIPFGPTATRIIKWSASPAGREILLRDFAAVGAYPILCGHGDIAAGVFAREKFLWPVEPHRLVVHASGFAADIFKSLKIVVRALPLADLYLGYAAGVVDLLSSRNPAMASLAGYGQVSRYFYYPSWERRNAFAMLLMRAKTWAAPSVASRRTIEQACADLNALPRQFDRAGMLAIIGRQGRDDTIVSPWPPAFVAAARRQWKTTAGQITRRHPSLAQAFLALNIP